MLFHQIRASHTAVQVLPPGRINDQNPAPPQDVIRIQAAFENSHGIQLLYAAGETQVGVFLQQGFKVLAHRPDIVPLATGKQRAEQAMVDAIQHAYYLRAMNPSDNNTQVTLAAEPGLDEEQFSEEAFHPPEVRWGFYPDQLIQFQSITGNRPNTRFTVSNMAGCCRVCHPPKTCLEASDYFIAC